MEGRARFLRLAVSRLAVSLLAGALVSVSSLGPPALAVTRSDPWGDAAVDVWRTSRNRAVIDEAFDRVRFKVIAQLSNDWSVAVRLDTRGGPGAEYRLRNFEAFGRSQCRIWRLPNGEPRRVRCGRKSIDDVLLYKLWWSVPRPWLAPAKAIRWHVRTHDVGGSADGPDDRAPDTGTYP